MVIGGFEGGFTSFPNQNRSGGNRHLLGKVLWGECSRDVDGDLVPLQDDRGGIDFEVDVLDRLDHFGQAAASQKCGGNQGGK